MKNTSRLTVSLFIVLSFLTNALPCGPSYVSPVFNVRSAPENPYENFAAGRIGIVKPTFHRSVLFGAYRWLNGGGLMADEQKALVEVWKADFDNRDFEDNDVTPAVRDWVEKRKEVVGKEEKVPAIYVERNYGGYDFFPNCTKNAFETATATLADRIASHGSEDQNVREWLNGQDAVFDNCASGAESPAEPGPEMPEWLRKDRAYQLAAASFYSLDYDDAKRRFEEIGQDSDSPWSETAAYLVGRTLIRQASLSKDKEKTVEIYAEAEQVLQRQTSGKYGDSAEKLLGLIAYRVRPQERVRELAQRLSYGGSRNFRQDVIDYTWLLDKFEKETLDAEENRKKADNAAVNTINRPQTVIHNPITNTNTYLEDTVANATPPPAEISANAVANAANAMANAAAIAIANAANTAAYNDGSGYEGGYYGQEELSLSILPEFLRYEDLTDWLFTYQIGDNEAYLYSLNKYKQTGSELWLLTALSKAKRTSTELSRLLEAAGRANRSSVAYPTIAYNAARIYIDQGKSVDAKKVVNEALDYSANMPVSSVNQFVELREGLADTLDDFLSYSLRKPFAFDYGGSIGTIEEFIAEEKTYYNPEYNKDGKEAFEREVEERFATERQWQDRYMFDHDTVEMMNQFFPTSVLSQIERSDLLPDYLRSRFALAIWTRAVVLDDISTANRIAPEVVKHNPDLAELMNTVTAARTPAARQNAILFLIIKNPMLTPFIEDGLGKTDNEANQWDFNDWWCEPYDEIYDEDSGDTVSRDSMAKPAFLTSAQIAAASTERAKLKRLGNAPQYLGERVLAWVRRSPNDRRLPEALYIMHGANAWTKYGCGSNEELQETIGELLKRRYPNSLWTQKLLGEEAEDR